MRKAHVYGASFAVTTTLVFMAHAAVFYLGAWLIQHDGLNFVDMLRCVNRNEVKYTIIFASYMYPKLYTPLTLFSLYYYMFYKFDLIFIRNYIYQKLSICACRVFLAIVFGAMSIGQMSHYSADYGKAKSAAANIFTLLDRVPEIDSFSDAGMKPVS